MDFELPDALQAYLGRLDAFIQAQILPLQRRDDNERFFDHRREPSRTQWDNGGLPTDDWEQLLAHARQLADAAGFYRFALPRQYGGAVVKAGNSNSGGEAIDVKSDAGGRSDRNVPYPYTGFLQRQQHPQLEPGARSDEGIPYKYTEFLQPQQSSQLKSGARGDEGVPRYTAFLQSEQHTQQEPGARSDEGIPYKYAGFLQPQQHPQLNLWMCAIRYHLASHPVYGGGVSLANDLQTEHSVVGNFPDLLMLHYYGTEQQRRELIPARLRGEFRVTFGLTEAGHGSDATHMDTKATPITFSQDSSRDGGYLINGNKKWQTGMHQATHMIVFARTSGRAGSARGITAFIVPVTTPGVRVLSYEYTLNMPTDHASVELRNVRVPASAILGPLDNGLAIAHVFTHENRIRQASSSCGAAAFCVAKAVDYAKNRSVFGKSLAANQAIQWPLVELATQIEMLRLLILRTANDMDLVFAAHTESQQAQRQTDGTQQQQQPWVVVEQQLGHRISMCNYYANRLATQAADTAIQVHGGLGYSRHVPFEHIWRHFRRYRITEGSEEVQMRRVAAHLFGYKTSESSYGNGKGNSNNSGTRRAPSSSLTSQKSSRAAEEEGNSERFAEEKEEKGEELKSKL